MFNRNDIAEKIAQLALNSNHSLTKSKKKKEEIPYKNSIQFDKSNRENVRNNRQIHT